MRVLNTQLIIISIYIFKGRPTPTATPCPGEVALEIDGTCPEFACDADACKKAGTCKNDGSCSCYTIYGFEWIDCTLGKIIQGFTIDKSFKCFWLVYLFCLKRHFQLAFT